MVCQHRGFGRVLTSMLLKTLPPPPELSRGVRGLLVGSVVSSKYLLPHCVSLSAFYHRLISSSSIRHWLWVTCVACRACGATAAFVSVALCVLAWLPRLRPAQLVSTKHSLGRRWSGITTTETPSLLPCSCLCLLEAAHPPWSVPGKIG